MLSNLHSYLSFDQIERSHVTLNEMEGDDIEEPLSQLVSNIFIEVFSQE